MIANNSEGIKLQTIKDSHKPKVCITFDDPNSYDTPLLNWIERNNKILHSLKKHSLHSALFVCGHRINNHNGRTILKKWNDACNLICNHTFSHFNLNSNKITINQFEEDFIKNDSIINHFSHYRKFFRFPFLKEGNSTEKRDGVRHFLKIYQYRTGYVSIDASDWYIDERLKLRLKKNQNSDITPYKKFYFQHILERANFYNDLSKKVLGREIKHVLLLHHNLLNALFLDELIVTLQKNGWEFIDAISAYEDEVYKEYPEIIPAGESILWALAKQTGKYDNILRYPGEDGEYEKENMDKLGL